MIIFYLGLGVLALLLGLWLLRAFVAADPRRLAQSARRLVWVIGAIVLLLLFIGLLASGQLGKALIDLGPLGLVLMRLWAQWQRRKAVSGPPPGQTSEVETAYLRMTLDHDSGTMTGTVRRGPFQGRGLDELSREELISLWRECRAEDPQAAALLEAYLERAQPGWREEPGGSAGAGTGSGGPGRAADAMTRDEAYAILGLAPGATEAAIHDAYRRLMMKIHPDHGGSTYLAAKINRARDLLLGG
jgi:hypothetical protein